MDANALPTVTLAPPPGLVSSRSLHVQPLAAIPLIISLSISAVTAIYFWKLWQREDKFYVEEVWSEIEDGAEEKHCEAILIKPLPITAAMPGAIVREERPDTPKSLIAARQEAMFPEMTVSAESAQRRSSKPESLKVAHPRTGRRGWLASPISAIDSVSLNPAVREALARRGISSPFTPKTILPHDIRDPAWPSVKKHEQAPYNALPVLARKPVPVSVPSPPPLPASFPTPGSTFPSPNDVASYKSTRTWERSCIERPIPNVDPNSVSAQPMSPSPIQDDHNQAGGLLTPKAANNILRQSAQSTKSNAISETTEVTVATSGLVRQSGIDWNDGEESLVSSNFSRSNSEFDRESYHDKYADY